MRERECERDRVAAASPCARVSQDTWLICITPRPSPLALSILYWLLYHSTAHLNWEKIDNRGTHIKKHIKKCTCYVSWLCIATGSIEYNGHLLPGSSSSSISILSKHFDWTGRLLHVPIQNAAALGCPNCTVCIRDGKRNSFYCLKFTWIHVRTSSSHIKGDWVICLFRERASNPLFVHSSAQEGKMGGEVSWNCYFAFKPD